MSLLLIIEVQVIIYLNWSFKFIYLNAITLEISGNQGDIGKEIRKRKETQFCISR